MAEAADSIVEFYHRSRRHGQLGSVSPEPFGSAYKVRREGVRSVPGAPATRPYPHEYDQHGSCPMNILEHLFLEGEFPERGRLLSGLTLEQVKLRPEGATHSIYEELWHVVGYQQSIIEPGMPVDPSGDLFPRAAPEDERQWRDLVRVFMDGARAAAALEREPERLAQEVSPGVTLADELNCVAIHNAYHLGKIVALRQRIGAWPPASAADGS